MKKKISKILALVCLILGSFFALYVGGWLLLVRPICTVLSRFSDGTLDMSTLVWSIVKIAFSMTFAGLVWCVGYVGYNHFIGTEDPDWEAIERERGIKKEQKEESSDS